MNWRERFSLRVCQILAVSWIYITVSLTIMALFVVDRKSWEEQKYFEMLDSETAVALAYIGLCSSVITLIIAPIFALSVVFRGPYVATIFMLIAQHVWLFLTVSYLMSGFTSLIPSKHKSSDYASTTTKSQDPVGTKAFTISPLSVVFLVLAPLQLWFIKIVLTFRNVRPRPMIRVRVNTQRAPMVAGPRHVGRPSESIPRTASLPTYAEAVPGELGTVFSLEGESRHTDVGRCEQKFDDEFAEPPAYEDAVKKLLEEKNLKMVKSNHEIRKFSV